MALKLLPPHEQGQFVSGISAPGLDDDPGVRKFVGDGSTHLSVPGLLEVENVYIGTREIPLFETLEYPLDGSERPRMGSTPHQLIAIDSNETGETILLRSTRSNDGVWQKGQAVYIRGAWKDDKKKSA